MFCVVFPFAPMVSWYDIVCWNEPFICFTCPFCMTPFICVLVIVAFSSLGTAGNANSSCDLFVISVRVKCDFPVGELVM